ncbi:MAG: hypothetical protein PHF89_04965 [Eubacteriales bacterium]|nr:hypothetical protein [Eubacteriales bacterium]
MVKKFLPALFAAFLIYTVSYAATVEEVTGRVVSKLLIETAVDWRILLRYKDWFYIDDKYKAAMAGALHAGAICPRDGLLNPKGDDLSSVIKGLVRFGIKSTAFEIKDLSKDHGVTFPKDTLYLIDGEIVDELHELHGCFAIVNRDNKAFVVWRDKGVQVNSLYAGKLYLMDGQRLIITQAQSYGIGIWKSISSDKYIDVILGDNVQIISGVRALSEEDVILNHLDSKVYVLGRLENKSIKAVYIELISE